MFVAELNKLVIELRTDEYRRIYATQSAHRLYSYVLKKTKIK
jgi:hypothetical protein